MERHVEGRAVAHPRVFTPPTKANVNNKKETKSPPTGRAEAAAAGSPAHTHRQTSRQCAIYRGEVEGRQEEEEEEEAESEGDSQLVDRFVS